MGNGVCLQSSPQPSFDSATPSRPGPLFTIQMHYLLHGPAQFHLVENPDSSFSTLRCGCHLRRESYPDLAISTGDFTCQHSQCLLPCSPLFFFSWHYSLLPLLFWLFYSDTSDFFLNLLFVACLPLLEVNSTRHGFLSVH